MTADAGSGSVAEPTCPRHPDRVAYVRCQRCDRPTCPECQRPAAVGIQCVDCVNAAQRQARPLKSRLGFKAAAGPPLVTYSIIAANVAAFGYGFFVNRFWLVDWALVPAWTATEPWRIVTSNFAHDGPFHLAMNMFVLWQLGSLLEPALGRVRFAIIYALSGLGGSLAVQFLSADLSGTVGASGAVFGLIAAHVIVLRTLRIPYRNAALLAGGLLLAGFLITYISWQGHLGGAVTGAVVMVVMLRGVQRSARSRTPSA